jgi:putative ABC transport system substrate-binding protein
MAISIGRRQFISALGAAATYPLAVRAQQPAMPVIGWLSGTSAEASKPTLGAFQNALADAGYAEGRNIQFEYR